MKKGFTLIELLAVILILGIIALIAIPTVTNMIEESKRGALRTTALTLVKQSEQACTLEMMKGNTPTLFYTITDNKVSGDLNIKNLPKSGEIELDNNCKSKVAVSDGKYCVITDGDTIDFKEDASKCVLNDVVYTAEKCFRVSNNKITSYYFDDEDCNTNTVVIPDTIDGQVIKSIGSYTFRLEDPNDMYNYIIPSNITLFDLSNMKHLETLESDVFTSNYTDQDINNFTVKLPNNGTLKTIEYGAFSNYDHNIELPEGLISIDRYAFYNYKNESFIIPSTVTEIGDSALASQTIRTIINKTGRSFNWKRIIGAYSCTPSDETFITGSCEVNYETINIIGG